MKIAVGSLGANLDAWVGARFGYCPQFVIVDTETMDCVMVPMPPTPLPITTPMRGAVDGEAASPACSMPHRPLPV